MARGVLRRPDRLSAPSSLVDGACQRQSSSVCYEDREFPEHLVTVHPVKGLPNCGDSKRSRPERNALGPGTQPLDVLSAPRCGQTSPLGDHVCVWIDRDNLGDGAGKRDCDGAWAASQIQGARALAEIVALDDEINCRMRVWRTEAVIVRRGPDEWRGF